MDFVFKLSFFLHNVTNQNFKKKKKAKFIIINKAKIESKKTTEKRVWLTSFFHATFSAFSCYIQCILVLHSVYLTVKQHSRLLALGDANASPTATLLAAVGSVATSVGYSKLPSSSFFPPNADRSSKRGYQRRESEN